MVAGHGRYERIWLPFKHLIRTDVDELSLQWKQSRLSLQSQGVKSKVLKHRCCFFVGGRYERVWLPFKHLIRTDVDELSLQWKQSRLSLQCQGVKSKVLKHRCCFCVGGRYERVWLPFKHLIRTDVDELSLQWKQSRLSLQCQGVKSKVFIHRCCFCIGGRTWQVWKILATFQAFDQNWFKWIIFTMKAQPAFFTKPRCRVKST